MFASLKSRPSWATAVVPPAANIARPQTSSRRLSEPFSKRETRSEISDSIGRPFLECERGKSCGGSQTVARMEPPGPAGACHRAGQRPDPVGRPDDKLRDIRGRPNPGFAV